MDVSKLSGIELDIAVAQLERVEVVPLDRHGNRVHLGVASALFQVRGPLTENYAPSINWAQAGPIIERERIAIEPFKDTSKWSAFKFDTGDCEMRCETPLIAAMRCYVASKAAPQTQK